MRLLVMAAAIAIAACGSEPDFSNGGSSGARIIWAKIYTRGSDGVFVEDGYANGMVARYTNAGTVEVTITDPFPSAEYAVIVTPTNAMEPVVIKQTPERFEISALQYAANDLLDLRAFDTALSVVVVGDY